MDDQSRAELGLEPGGLGGHDVACVGNVHELLHRYGIEGEVRHGGYVLSAVFECQGLCPDIID